MRLILCSSGINITGDGTSEDLENILAEMCMARDSVGVNIIVEGAPACGKTWWINRFKEIIAMRAGDVVVNHVVLSGTLGAAQVRPTQINIYETNQHFDDQALRNKNIHFHVMFEKSGATKSNPFH